MQTMLSSESSMNELKIVDSIKNEISMLETILIKLQSKIHNHFLCHLFQPFVAFFPLYLFSVNKSNTKQLVFCDADLNLGSPVFLKIQNHDPVALFGGCNNFAAISREGEVIFIRKKLVIE